MNSPEYITQHITLPLHSPLLISNQTVHKHPHSTIPAPSVFIGPTVINIHTLDKPYKGVACVYACDRMRKARAACGGLKFERNFAFSWMQDTLAGPNFKDTNSKTW